MNSEMLNAAMRAYVQTIQNRSRLTAYLKEVGAEALEDEILIELNAVLKCAEDRLWQHAGQIDWQGGYEIDHIKHLKEHHTWLDDEALARVINYSQWLCWHEGLNQ